MTAGQRANYDRLGLPHPARLPKGWAWWGPYYWVRQENCGRRFRCPWCRVDGFKLELRPEKWEHAADCPRAALMEGDGESHAPGAPGETT